MNTTRRSDGIAKVWTVKACRVNVSKAVLCGTAESRGRGYVIAAVVVCAPG
jgi:hypothetical protein